MRTLISGAGSGLGAWLLKRFGAMRFNRHFMVDDTENKLLPHFDLIVHCASSMPTENERIDAYVGRLTTLCTSLLRMPHRKFVFISSVEAAAVPPRSAYAVGKRYLEELVFTISPEAIVLRPGALFGSGMRMNQVLKVAVGDEGPLSLAPQSRFSIVMYEDVYAALEVLPSGTWHLMANRLVSLSEIAETFQTKPLWGEYRYDSPDLPCDIPWSNYNQVQMDPIDRLVAFVGGEHLNKK